MAKDFLTDREYAVTIDSLAVVRDDLNKQGIATPTIESALEKLHNQVAPNSQGLWILMKMEV